MSKVVRKIGKRLYSCTALIIVLVLWELLPRAGIVSKVYLPPLSSVLAELIWELKNGYLFLNVILSLYRVLAGLLLAVAVGILLGLILGYLLPGLADSLFPLLRIFGQINPYSMLPLFVVFLGIGEKSKIAMVAWTAIWPILFHTITGARAVDTELLKSARSMGATKAEILGKIILPASGPSIFDGLRVGVEMSFFMLIAVEMSGGTGGLGIVIHVAGMNFLITRLLGAGLCTVILGVCLNQFFYYMQKRIFFWKETVRFFNREQPSGHERSMGVVQIVIICLLCIMILVTGYFQSIRAYRLVNDPENSGEFGNIQSE